MMKKYDLALIFPCFNEELRVGKTFAAYYDYLLNSPDFKNQRVVLVFINDGSSDKTAEIINSFCVQSRPNLEIKAVNYEKNLGKGGAVKEGIKSVEAEYYGYIDADLSYGPELLPAMAAELKNNDLAIAQKIAPKKLGLYDFTREIFSNFLQSLVNYFVGLKKIDTQRGFKFFNYQAAQKILLPARENRFAFDIEILAAAKEAGLKIKAVPVNFVHDKNSTVTWKDGCRYLFDIIAIADRAKKTAASSFWRTLIIFYALLIAALFGWTIFTAYFFSDDFTWLYHGAKINLDIGRILSFRMSTFYSPVLNLFYTAMYKIFAYSAPAYFISGLLAHLANSLLAAIIAWQLSRSRLTAFLSGLIFSWAGGAFEPLVWIGANMHSFASFFILSGLAFYIAFLNSGRKIYLPFSFLAAILALGSKEIAIVFPALLAAIVFSFWPKYKNKIFQKAQIAYLLALGIFFSLYAYQQYLWQKQSVWVASGVWSFSWHTIAKLPIVIMDIFVPLGEIASKLHGRTEVSILILTTSISLAAIFYFYRRLALVRLGFLWLIISIAPTIFLQTIRWWDPLASRYTYLPRLGMILILAAILHYHISKNTSRHIINAFAAIIILIAASQIFIMVKIVNRDYLYVYNAGRSLHAIMLELKKIQPAKTYVRWDYPFTGNNAHIVGAAYTIAGKKEDYLIFLPQKNNIKPQKGEALLYWDAEIRQYKIKISN